MSALKKLPAGPVSFILFGLLGVGLTALCLAGMAQLMTLQSYSGSLAAPLATAAVCLASMLSALAAAAWKRQRALITGLMQGGLLAGILAVFGMVSGTSTEPLLLIRMAAAVLCGGLGGLLGMALRERRHPLR